MLLPNKIDLALAEEEDLFLAEEEDLVLAAEEEDLVLAEDGDLLEKQYIYEEKSTILFFTKSVHFTLGWEPAGHSLR